MFKEFKENGLNEQLGNLDREMTTIKMKILKLESTGTEMKNSLYLKVDYNVRRKNQ